LWLVGVDEEGEIMIVNMKVRPEITGRYYLIEVSPRHLFGNSV
jgi:hypothetical protein